MSDEILDGALPEDEGYEPDILTLEDESGQEHAFEVVDACDFNGERYLAMVPYEEDPTRRLEQDAEMVIMRVAEQDGEEVLDIVEDDDELYTVGQEFLRRMQEVFDIDLDDLM